MGLFDRDSRGYALSLDLLLALIPLTLVLGIVAADMDNVMYQMQDVIYRGSTERVAADTMNSLLTSPGNPNNWETNINTLKVPGLAKYDTTTNQTKRYYLAPNKVASVTSSQIQNVIGTQYGYSLNIVSINNGNHSILLRGTLNDSSVDTNAKDVVRVERIVMFSEYDVVSEGVNIRGTGKPLVVSANSFPTNKQYNSMFDYWVYINYTGVTSASVDINSVTVVKPDDFKQNRLPIKIDPAVFGADVLKNETVFQDNLVTIRLEGSPSDKMNVYILQVPKGTSKDDITLTGANPSKYRATLYVWTR